MGWERKRGKLEEFNRLLRGATDTSFTTQVGPAEALAGIRYVHHARFRYAAAARHRARADRHHRTPAEPAGGASAVAARRRRLRHPAAARQRDDGQRRRVAVRAHLRRPHRRRSVHHRGVGRVPGPLRRRHLHRQGPLRRRCVHGLARGPRAGERAAVARPVRRPARARRPRHRRRSRGRLPVERADARAGGSTAGCAATGRSCGGCSRGCRRASGLERNRLPIISRWKILDNLRRSLVPPSLVALFVAGWTVLPGRPLLLDAGRDGDDVVPGAVARLLELARRPAHAARASRVFLRSIARGSRRPIWRASAFSSRSSPTRRGTCSTRSASRWPAWSSRRGRFLQWETAAAVAQRTRKLDVTRLLRGACDRARSSRRSACCSLIVLRPDGAGRRPADPAACGLPRRYFAFLLSKPVPSSRPELTRHRPRLPAAARRADLALLRDLRHRRGPLAAARQRPVRSRAAHRASHLADQHRDDVAVDACRRYDLELIDVDHADRRASMRTLTTVDRLEHFEGHLLNWYDTQTLEPLLPKYVSTVDSGNLAAALLTLASGLREIAAADKPMPAMAARLDALAARASRLLRRDALRVPLRPQAPAVRDRLPPRRRDGRGAHGQRVLRPARVGSAAGELHRHRQGRRARDALVPSRPPDHRRARLAGAAVVERHDVRVPDAAAGDAQLSGDAARRVVPHGGAPADRLRRHARHAVGHLRERPTPPSIATATISTRRSACRAWA